MFANYNNNNNRLLQARPNIKNRWADKKYKYIFCHYIIKVWVRTILNFTHPEKRQIQWVTRYQDKFCKKNEFEKKNGKKKNNDIKIEASNCL